MPTRRFFGARLPMAPRGIEAKLALRAAVALVPAGVVAAAAACCCCNSNDEEAIAAVAWELRASVSSVALCESPALLWRHFVLVSIDEGGSLAPTNSGWPSGERSCCVPAPAEGGGVGDVPSRPAPAVAGWNARPPS